MPSPRRNPFLVALVVPVLGLAACADDAPDTATDAAAEEADTDATTTTTEAPVGTGKGTFVVGDRTYTFEAKRCTAQKGDPAGTVLAEGNGSFDTRSFTVTVRSSPGETSAIETVQVVFAATEAVVGTNYVPLPAGAADVALRVSEDGKAAGTITVMGTGGQPSGEGTLTLECDPA